MPVVIALAIGACAGVIAALCGVGGGVIMVPAFRHFLGMDQKMAVATSLAAIIGTAVAATLPNVANRFIDGKVALAAALGGAVVAWFAADSLKRFSNQTLEILFACVMILMGCQMLWKSLRG